MKNKVGNRRGTCPRCGYRVRLRKDGTVGVHQALFATSLLFTPFKLAECKGVGKEPCPLPLNGYLP